MPKQKLVYAIDDSLNIDENLTSLSAATGSIDADLAVVLEPRLATWASGEAVDTAALWNALYEATENSGEDQA